MKLTRAGSGIGVAVISLLAVNLAVVAALWLQVQGMRSTADWMDTVHLVTQQGSTENYVHHWLGAPTSVLSVEETQEAFSVGTDEARWRIPDGTARVLYYGTGGWRVWIFIDRDGSVIGHTLGLT